MKRTASLVLAVMIMALGAVSASAAGDLTTNIGINNSYTGGDLTIKVYVDGDYENIINNILLNNSIINGNVKIEFVASDGFAINDDRWKPQIEDADFRGDFAPRLF